MGTSSTCLVRLALAAAPSLSRSLTATADLCLSTAACKDADAGLKAQCVLRIDLKHC